MSTSAFELGVVLSLRDMASSKLDEINKKWDAMKDKLGETHKEVLKMEGAINTLKTGGMLLGAGLAVGALTKTFVDARLKTSELEGNIKSLGLTNKEVDKITDSAYTMSQAMGMSTDDILSGVYDIKSAVSELKASELTAFTQSVADAAIATKGNFGEMSKLFGMAYSQFKQLYGDMDNVKFGKNLANDIAWAANKYRADGGTINQAMQSIGSEAANLKISLEEQSAVLGRALNTKMGGEAGTAYRSFLSNLSEGFNKLGFSQKQLYNDNGKLKNTAELLGLIKGKFGETISLPEGDLIKKAFGDKEAVGFIKEMLPQLDAMKSDIAEIVGLSAKGDYSALDIAKKANIESFSNQVKRTSMGWENFQKIIGKGIENSGLRSIFSGLADILAAVNEFLIARPKLAEFVGTFLMISTAVLTGVGAFMILKGAYTAFMVAVNLGLVSNPFGWIIIGVVGAIAALTAVIVYWDEIKSAGSGSIKSLSESWLLFQQDLLFIENYFRHLWLTIQIAGTTALNYITNRFDAFIGWFQTQWTKMKTAWSEMPDWARGLIAVVMAILFLPLIPIALIGVQIYKHWDSIKAAGGAVSGYLSQKWDSFVAGAGNIWNGITQKWDVGISTLTQKSGAVSDYLSQKWDSFAAGAGDIWNGITQKWDAGMSAIGTWFENKLGGLWKGVTNWARTSGIGLLKAFGDGVLSGLDFVLTPLKYVLNAIGRFLPHSNADEGPLSDLTGSGAALIDTFGQGIASRKSALGSTLGNVVAPPPSFLDSALNYGASFVDTLTSGITKSVGVLKTGLNNMLGIGIKPSMNQSDAKEGPLANTSGYGRSFVKTVASGIESEAPRMNPVMQRLNQMMTPEKGIIRRMAEETEADSISVPGGKSKGGINLTIGSLIGQLSMDGAKDRKSLGEILVDALFAEIERYDEVVA